MVDEVVANDWLAVLLIDWFTDWLIDDCWAGWLFGGLVVADCLVGIAIGWLALLIGWLVDDCRVGWLID